MAKMDNVTTRLVVYVLAIPVLLLYVLIATGCVSTSPGVPNIYLFELARRPDGGEFQARVGYFGICAGNASSLACASSSGADADTMLARLGMATNDVGKDIFNRALLLQSHILLWLIIPAAVLFLLGILVFSALKWQQKRATSKPRTEKILRSLTVVTLWLSTAVAFAATLATSQTTGALAYTSHAESAPTFLISQGKTLQILQWVVCILSVLFSGGITLVLKAGASDASSNYLRAGKGSGDKDRFSNFFGS